MKEKFYLLNVYAKNNPIELTTFLDIALNLSLVVHELHQKDRMHGNLLPSNILCSNRQKIKLKERNLLTEKEDVLTKVYKAPEQITKPDLKLSPPVDIYTLGLIFYELLTTKLPYTYSNSLVFSHLLLTTKIPSLNSVNKDIPIVLSMIVDKMLEKNAKKRYQNILSAYIDLSTLAKSLAHNRDMHNFKVDHFQSFFSNSFLYGRDKELEAIEKFLEANVEKSNQICMLSGESGVGKTVLKNKALEKHKNTFSYILTLELEEKAQENSEVFLQEAFRDLSQQVLTKDEETLATYREKINKTLGTQVDVLMDVIPEVEIMMAKREARKHDKRVTQPKMPLNELLLRFLKVVAMEEKPLCIAIDDFQWADSPMLQWLEMIMLNLSNVRIIMTHQEEIVPSFQETIPVTRLKLSNLSLKETEEWIFEYLPLNQIEKVSRIIHSRTKGNPFFIKEYLQQLHDNKAIWFDLNTLQWEYELTKIEQLKITDTFLTVLLKKINSLAEDEKRLLQCASCIGHGFSEVLLKHLYQEESFEALFGTLLKDEWLRHEGGNEKLYFFVHEKLESLVYKSIEKEESTQIHKEIGLFLYEDEVLKNKNLLNCVKHLNKAHTQLEDKKLLSELNLKASLQSKEQGEFRQALSYIKQAMELRDMTLESRDSVRFFKQRAVCEHLCHNKQEAIWYYEKALASTQSKLLKGEIYEELIKFYADTSDFNQAYETAILATQFFDLEIPKRFVPPVFVMQFIHLKFKLQFI